MKRILMLNYEFPPLGGGGGVFCLRLAKGYINAGYQVDYVTSCYKGLKSYEQVEGINIYRVPAVGRSGLQTANFLSMLSYVLFGTLRGAWLCIRNFREYEFIHTIFVIPTGPVGLILSKLFGLKNLLTLVGGDIYDPSKKSSPHRKAHWRQIVKFIINHADSLTAISNDVKRNSIKYYSPGQDITVIGLPYEKQSFTPKSREELGLKSDAFYVIAVGRMVTRKGFNFLVEAIHKLPANIHALIIGGGPEQNNLMQLARSLGIQDRIVMPGYVASEEEKFQYLNVADAYVLSSLHEGFGIVLQEAMQVGLPLIATKGGGQEDIVTPGKHGLLVEPQNSQSLAEAILHMYQDNQLRQTMSAQNKQDVNNYDWTKINFTYLAAINGK